MKLVIKIGKVGALPSPSDHPFCWSIPGGRGVVPLNVQGYPMKNYSLVNVICAVSIFFGFFVGFGPLLKLILEPTLYLSAAGAYGTYAWCTDCNDHTGERHVKRCLMVIYTAMATLLVCVVVFDKGVSG